MKLKAALTAQGYAFMIDSPTNQQFPVVPDAALPKLAEKYSFATIQKTDDAHTAIRFCTSWATREADVDALIADMAVLAGNR